MGPMPDNPTAAGKPGLAHQNKHLLPIDGKKNITGPAPKSLADIMAMNSGNTVNSTAANKTASPNKQTV